MGFSKLLRDIYQESVRPKAGSSFAAVDREELQTHLAISRYGRFELTDAIRPSYDLRIVPIEGFRHDVYVDQASGVSIPVVMGAVSKERLLETFFDLLDRLGPVVDVVLESSHKNRHSRHLDYTREEMDLPVLKSVLYDFDDILLNDGCTGIAVLNPNIPHEVQFDEHKLLLVYGDDTASSERVFSRHRVENRESLRFLTEAEHVHSSKASFHRRFTDLRVALGMDYDEVF